MATPRRSLTMRSSSALPVVSAPRSWSRRPISVDLPWSTWPTTTNCSGALLMRAVCSHIALRAQAFEGVLALVVHGAPRALGLVARLKLQNDLGNRGRRGRHREGDVFLAERAEPPAITGEIERHHRHALALDVAPDIDLGPAKQRMDAHMAAWRGLRVELVPEFRRLMAEIPGAGGVARAEDALLAPDRLLVAADAEDHTLEAALGDNALEAQRLARGGARLGRKRRVGLLHPGTGRVDIGETPLPDDPIPELVDLGKFVACVEQDHRKRHAAEERLAREPEQRVRILPYRPQHTDRL